MKHILLFTLAHLIMVTGVYSQFTTVKVKIAESSDASYESFDRPTSSDRLCLIRGQKYTIRFSAPNLWLGTFNRIEITEGDFNQTFNKDDLIILPKNDNVNEDRIIIPELSIPSSSDREDFLIKLRYWPELNGPDVCYAKVIERGSFASAEFIGSVRPVRAGNKVVLKPNTTYRLRLTGNNLDHANPFVTIQTLREGINSGMGTSFTFSNVTRTGTTMEVNVSHNRTSSDLNINAKNMRVTDKEADDNTPKICNYVFAANMPLTNTTGTTPTNMTDWLAGYGVTVLPDLLPVIWPVNTVYFRPKTFGVSLNASNGNVYMELPDGFNNLVSNPISTTTIQVPGLGSANELLIDLPDLNYGVINQGAMPASTSDFLVRVRRFRLATDNSSSATSSNTIQAANFPPRDITRLVVYVRPPVKVYTFPTQPGKFFLRRENATTPDTNEEGKFEITVDVLDLIVEAIEDNNRHIIQ